MAGLGGLAAGEGMNVGRPKGLAADRPVTLFIFPDANPGDGSQRFAFDLDHRRGDLGDEFLFLLRGENVLDHVDGYEGHVESPGKGKGVYGLEAADGTASTAVSNAMKRMQGVSLTQRPPCGRPGGP